MPLVIIEALYLITFITARVADYLQSMQAKGCRIQSLQGRLDRYHGKYDFPRGHPATYMPFDVAEKYGRALGIAE